MAELASNIIGPETRLDDGLFVREATNSSLGQEHEDAGYRGHAVSTNHWSCLRLRTFSDLLRQGH